MRNSRRLTLLLPECVPSSDIFLKPADYNAIIGFFDLTLSKCNHWQITGRMILIKKRDYWHALRLFGEMSETPCEQCGFICIVQKLKYKRTHRNTVVKACGIKIRNPEKQGREAGLPDHLASRPPFSKERLTPSNICSFCKCATRWRNDNLWNNILLSNRFPKTSYYY